MGRFRRNVRRVGAWAILALLCAAPLGAGPVESQRLQRAKDLIADEQWVKAIAELQAAITDPKETNKAEALFWLAHSENQARDWSAAVDTIGRIEREYPRSPWVKPARSLRIEIAQRLQRNDVLWWTATPPPPPAAPGTPPVPPAPPVSGRHARPAAAPAVPPPPAMVPAPPAPPTPPAAWVPEGFLPDTDLRIQALGSLIRVDAPKAIPMLKDIALQSDDPREARRAVFVLAQSGRADARSTVMDLARMGSDPVRIAAVRELGHWGGPAVSNDLLKVYQQASTDVKVEIVTSLGELEDSQALMRIAQSEVDRTVRNVAIMRLGQAGGTDQLQALYGRSTAETKRAIIAGLAGAGSEDALIKIADQEKDPGLREEALRRLRLLGTPAARQYLDRLKQK